MELFVITVNGFQPLNIITKCSILNVAAVLDPLLFRMNLELKQSAEASGCVTRFNKSVSSV